MIPIKDKLKWKLCNSTFKESRSTKREITFMKDFLSWNLKWVSIHFCSFDLFNLLFDV